jgi:hypothetical protein
MKRHPSTPEPRPIPALSFAAGTVGIRDFLGDMDRDEPEGNQTSVRQPTHQKGCSCGCSPEFTDNKWCSACQQNFCEERNKCRRWDECHNAYCDSCAPDWLPEDGATEKIRRAG